MDITTQGLFKELHRKISVLPLCIKQVLYLELKDELESSITKGTLDLINKEACFQLYIPQLTFLAQKVIDTRSEHFSPHIYSLLDSINRDLAILEIAIKNDWSLIETSSYFVDAINAGLVVNPDSPGINGTAYYMSGHVRLGEYFIKLGKINIEQLDEALRAQIYLEEATDDKMGIGEILINLGLVTQADVDGILLLKDEGKKRFI